MENKRSKYLIDKKFQLGIIYKFLIMTAVNILSFYLVVYLFFKNLNQKAIDVGLSSDHIFYSFLDDQQGFMTYIFIIVAIFNAVIIICAGIYYSHKVAGPLYRLSQHFKSVNKLDDLKEVNLREGDYVGDLKSTINEMSKRLNR